jgi:hypothetical protein
VYACGLGYFELGNRRFPRYVNECSTESSCTAVVHNNWIVTYEAKVYRFKEHLMWAYDKGELLKIRTDAQFLFRCCFFKVSRINVSLFNKLDLGQDTQAEVNLLGS